MPSWFGSDGLKKLLTQLKTKKKLQSNLTHQSTKTNLRMRYWVRLGWFCRVGGLDAHP